MFPLSYQARTYRPRIDELEDRVCPDGGLNFSPFAHLSLNATVLAGHTVQFSGTVTGEHVAGYGIWITGSAWAYVISDSNGNFSCTTTQASLGPVTAVGMDMALHSTDIAYATIAKPMPSLTMSIAYGVNHSVTLSGSLNDLDASGRTITFTGVAGTAAVTDSTGHYSVTTTASALGDINAVESDLWGLASNIANVSVTNSTASIENFHAEHVYGNVWKLCGSVVDEHPEGLTVRFGGLECLTNEEATTDGNGWFEIEVTLGANDAGGTATAITTDWWGVDSDQVSTTLA